MAKHLKISKDYSIIIHYPEFENINFTFRPGVYMYNIFKDNDIPHNDKIIKTGDLIYSDYYESFDNIRIDQANNLIIEIAKKNLRNHLINQIV